MHILIELSYDARIGILIISHDFNLIMAMCQRAYHLQDGVMNHLGNPIDWFDTQVSFPSDINVSQVLKSLPKNELRRALAARY